MAKVDVRVLVNDAFLSSPPGKLDLYRTGSPGSIAVLLAGRLDIVV